MCVYLFIFLKKEVTCCFLCMYLSFQRNKLFTFQVIHFIPSSMSDLNSDQQHIPLTRCSCDYCTYIRKDDPSSLAFADDSSEDDEKELTEPTGKATAKKQQIQRKERKKLILCKCGTQFTIV